MTTTPRFPHLAACILTVCLAWSIGPAVSEAKGPQPKPDFTLSVFTPEWDWCCWGDYPVGTFSATGLIDDSGDVYYLGSFRDIYDNYWNQCLFVGLHGSFEAALPARPENHAEYAFELFNGTDAYVGLHAAGTAKATTKRSFWQEEKGNKVKEYYLDVSWKMEGFLLP
jgi:hypothetical protein